MSGIRLYQEQLPIQYPHTFAGMQKLVMAMADVVKNAGKTTWFGRDKGAAAYDTFLRSLRQTIIGLLLDGQIQESSSEEEVIVAIVGILQKFSLAFPNWHDAYGFAGYFFGDENEANCLATIRRMRSA